MENQRLDFGEIVRKIAEDKMLLPDFQREFVWKDEEQRKIVASVLAKMPIDRKSTRLNSSHRT